MRATSRLRNWKHISFGSSGHYQQAEAAYERVIALAADLQSERERDVVTARAKRYLAEIEPGVFHAYQRMRAGLDGNQFAPGPIVLLDRCQPLSSWEWVEKGDMHYFIALLASRQGFVIVEGQNLNDADAAYDAALRSIRKSAGRSGNRRHDCANAFEMDGSAFTTRARTNATTRAGYRAGQIRRRNQPQK